MPATTEASKAWSESGGRVVYAGVEHGEIEIPPQLLITGDRFDLYETVESRGYFKIHGRGSKLVFQAGKFIGLIPINDRVAIEVRPRVPIGNLERILEIVEGYEPRILDFKRNYEEVRDRPASILDVLCDSFLASVDALRDEGLFKDYRRERVVGSPTGRILPLASTIAQLRTGKLLAVSQRFSRTVDNDVNRYLLHALLFLKAIYDGTPGRSGRARRLSMINQLLGLFDGVSSNSTEPESPRADCLPSSRPDLVRASSLGAMILRHRGLGLRENRGSVNAPSILIEMEDVFEAYVRDVMRRRCLPFRELTVLDGNRKRPAGGAGVLFERVLSELGNSASTPDTIIQQGNRCLAIIETKYKICKGLPDRADLNQAITYGYSFGCARVFLTYPSYGPQSSIAALGEVGGVRIYKAEISLGADRLDASESEFGSLLLDATGVGLDGI